MLRSRAAHRHTGAELTAPEAAINFRSQLQLCFPPAWRSIAPSFHLTRYFPIHTPVPFHQYLCTVGQHTREMSITGWSVGPIKFLLKHGSQLSIAIRYSSIPCMT